MNVSITFMLTLLFLVLNISLKAQKAWSLNQCIEYGIKNNLQLQNDELNGKLAQKSYQQSKWNLLPGISAGADAGRNFGRSIDPNTNGMINTSFFNNSYYLSASMDIFRGFMLQNQIRYFKLKKDAAENNRLTAIDNLAFEIMNAFFNVIYYQELLKIAGEQKNLSELNVKKTRILVSSGFKAQTELLDVVANLEKDELACIRVANEIESSWISLKKAMNLQQGLKISLINTDQDSTFNHPAGESVLELFNLHSAWSPKILLYKNEFLASKRDLAMKRAAFLPSVRLQASYNTGYYETNKDADNRIITFNTQIRNNQREFLGASLSIPVFGKNSVRYNVTQSKIISLEAENRLKQAEQDLLYEIEQNMNDLTASIKELHQAQRQLEADSLSFQAALKKFDQGMINVVDFYVIKNQYAGSSGQVLHSKLMLEIKKRMVDFYNGKRFWEL